MRNMRKKGLKEMKNRFPFIHPFFLLLISLAGSVQAQELRGFMYLYGEMGDDYFSDEKLINFRIGQIDFLSSLCFGRAEGLAELVVEEMIDVERLYFGYNFHKLFTLRVGRFHSPVGYFTRTWHHGLYLMPTIRRPFIIEFEDFGGPLPIHSGRGRFLILSYHVFGSELIYSIRPYLQIATFDWQDGNPYFEKLQAKLQEEREGRGYVARNLFNKHFEYSAGLRIGISPEFAVKIGFSFFDMKKIEDMYFISLSTGLGIPLYSRG